jgi:hypothetical protein
VSAAGSHEHAADRAARGAVAAGLSPLKAKLVTHVAGRGLDWQNDRQLRGELERPDGRQYHRESIGRARRELAKEGFLSSRRLLPGQALPNRARFGRTAHGTTLKAVVWQRFKQSPPTLRGARTRERQQLRRAERPQAPLTPAETLAAIAEAKAALDSV